MARPRFCYLCGKGYKGGNKNRLYPSIGIYREPEFMSKGAMRELLARLCISCYERHIVPVLRKLLKRRPSSLRERPGVDSSS